MSDLDDKLREILTRCRKMEITEDQQVAQIKQVFDEKDSKATNTQGITPEHLRNLGNLPKGSKPAQQAVYSEMFPCLYLDKEAVELLENGGKNHNLPTAYRLAKKLQQLYTSQITQPREGLK